MRVLEPGGPRWWTESGSLRGSESRGVGDGGVIEALLIYVFCMLKGERDRVVKGVLLYEQSIRLASRSDYR